MATDKDLALLSEKARELYHTMVNVYQTGDLSMYDLLAVTQVPDGLTMEDSFYLYMLLMNYAEGDMFFRSVNDGKPRPLIDSE